MMQIKCAQCQRVQTVSRKFNENQLNTERELRSQCLTGFKKAIPFKKESNHESDKILSVLNDRRNILKHLIKKWLKTGGETTSQDWPSLQMKGHNSGIDDPIMSLINYYPCHVVLIIFSKFQENSMKKPDRQMD